MLSERVTQLLTAYVDGELAPAERREADRVLRESEEARRLLRELQEDSEALRSLPRVSVSENFAEGVVRTASERGFEPARPRPAPALRWALPGMAAAAAVLLAAGLTVRFWSEPRPLADRVGLNSAHPPERATDERIAKSSDAPASGVGNNRIDTRLADADKTLQKQVAAAAPAPPAAVGRAGGGPPDLAKKDASVPALKAAGPADAESAGLQLALDDIAAADGRQRVVAALRRQGGGRVELVSAEHARVFENLRAALTRQGFVVGAPAEVGRATLAPQAGYVVFTESMTVDEVTATLTGLVGAERAQSQAGPVAGGPNRLTLTPLSPAAVDQLRAASVAEEVRPHLRHAKSARDVDQEGRSAQEPRVGGAGASPVAAPTRRRAVVLPGAPAGNAAARVQQADRKERPAGQGIAVLWIVRAVAPPTAPPQQGK